MRDMTKEERQTTPDERQASILVVLAALEDGWSATDGWLEKARATLKGLGVTNKEIDEACVAGDFK